MRGYLVIADISGYTQFLTEGELEHAHEIVIELLNSIIAAVHAPLELSGIEGDAVFMYGETPGDVFGQTILESVESLYVSFADALQTMVLNTSCRCNACANINGLGLKIVMHCGEFIRTEVGGTETLTGPDVIAVHRLLKNTVWDSTGIADYLLVTQACVDDLKLAEVAATWTEHTEDYEHVGRVTGYVSSLSDVWEAVRHKRKILVAEEEAWITLRGHTLAPPTVVWDHLIDPRKRNAWMAADSTDLVGTVDGRIGPGSEYHCAHGSDIGVFTVLDTRPDEYMTLMAPFVNGSAFSYTHYLTPTGSGTDVVTHIAVPSANDPDDTDAFPIDAGRKLVVENVGDSLDRLYAATDAADGSSQDRRGSVEAGSGS